MATEISVPDIGDFENIEIIEVLVKPGEVVNKNDPIVTLESDKSSVEVPSPYAGKISSLEVKIGDKVSKGSILAVIENQQTENLKEPAKKTIDELFTQSAGDGSYTPIQITEELTTRSIIVRGKEKDLDVVDKVIKEIDIRTKQVLIEAFIVEANSDFERAL